MATTPTTPPPSIPKNTSSRVTIRVSAAALKGLVSHSVQVNEYGDLEILLQAGQGEKVAHDWQGYDEISGVGGDEAILVMSVEDVDPKTTTT
ncbi:MAG TPA: hypothetical protein VEQ63_16430 [Bryobacteraceae bacterium]|nr:hypothetical protein [Bryobacteraceae bacterium]